MNLEVDKGDIFGVIGFSGAGKSTLLRMVNALETPTEGHVEIEGQVIDQLSHNELRKVRKKIGMIFQQFNLLDSRTVYENVAIPLRLNHTEPVQLDRTVKTLLQFVGLEDKAGPIPSSCPGGKNSGWALPGLWPPTPASSFAMKPPAPWIRKPRNRSSSCSGGSTRN